MLEEVSKILNNDKKLQEIQMLCLQIGELKARRNVLILQEKDARKIVSEINKLKKELEPKIERPAKLRKLFGDDIDNGIDRLCRDSMVIAF